jgi:exopolysaccharide biosynthesis polyprenyl glycosylphosphotransferase
MTIVERSAAFSHPLLGGNTPSVAVNRATGPERSRLGGHRAASWLLAVITMAALVLVVAGWSLLVPGRWIAHSLATVLVVLVILITRGHFRVRMVPDTISRLPLIAVAVAAGGSGATALGATPYFGKPDVGLLAWLLIALSCAIVAAQALGTRLLRWQWTKGNLRSRALVFGTDVLAREMAVEMAHRRDYGVDVVGFLDPSSGAGRLRLPAPAYGAGSDMVGLVELTGADRLIIGPAATADDAEAASAARRAAELGLAVFVVPRFHELGMGMDSMTPDRVRGYPLVRLQRSVHPRVALRLKRVLDVVVAGTVLALMAPIGLLVAGLIKLTSPGPVLFRQARVGQHGRTIMISKFRSMTVSDSSDFDWTAEARITPIGAWLRRTNIDELPQLWTVLRGGMSLVGPRPERPVFVARFSFEVPGYDERHRMPVGLTGLSQILGLRGDSSIPERTKYDNLYIDQWSLGNDVLILLKTFASTLGQASSHRRHKELEQALSRSVADSDASVPRLRPVSH